MYFQFWFNIKIKQNKVHQKKVKNFKLLSLENKYFELWMKSFVLKRNILVKKFHLVNEQVRKPYIKHIFFKKWYTNMKILQQQDLVFQFCIRKQNNQLQSYLYLWLNQYQYHLHLKKKKIKIEKFQKKKFFQQWKILKFENLKILNFQKKNFFLNFINHVKNFKKKKNFKYKLIQFNEWKLLNYINLWFLYTKLSKKIKKKKKNFINYFITYIYNKFKKKKKKKNFLKFIKKYIKKKNGKFY